MAVVSQRGQRPIPPGSPH